MARTSIEIKSKKEGGEIVVNNLQVASKNEDGAWTVFCPDLKVLGYSNRSEEDAFVDFEENLNVFFEIHVANNSLDKALTTFEWNRKEATISQKLKTSIGNPRRSSSIAAFTHHGGQIFNGGRSFKVPVTI